MKNHLTNKQKQTVTICYILSYYAPKYSRTSTLISALSNIPGTKLHLAINKHTNLLRYIETLFKLLTIRLFKNPEYYILGFRGYEIFFPVRLITINKHLVFDHMMSPYDSLLHEKKRIKSGGILDFLINRYEKLILSLSDSVITDTPSHKHFFCKLFDIPTKKIFVVPVGAEEDIFVDQIDGPVSTSTKKKPNQFEILFYGSFLPLHGIEFILEAAASTKLYPFHFTFIGGNRKNTKDFFRKIKELRLTSISHIDWVDKSELPQYIRNSDIVLGGPFGNTGQANRVITGKTFQSLAAGKAVIIGQTDNSFFMDKKNCLLVPQGCSKSIATALKWAYNHRTQLHKIGIEGKKLYLQNFSIERIGDALLPIIKQ